MLHSKQRCHEIATILNRIQKKKKLDLPTPPQKKSMLNSREKQTRHFSIIEMGRKDCLHFSLQLSKIGNNSVGRPLYRYRRSHHGFESCPLAATQLRSMVLDHSFTLSSAAHLHVLYIFHFQYPALQLI